MQRRLRLQAAAAAQREALAWHWNGVQPALRWVDHGVALARRVVLHPLLLVSLVAVMVIRRPRRALRWVRNAVILWPLLRGQGFEKNK